MVAKEFQPASGRIRIVGGTFHPARNGSFRDVETQLEQLSVDAGRSPPWVLSDHAKDQPLDLGVHTVDSFAMLDPDGRRDIRNYAGVIAILKFLDIPRDLPIVLAMLPIILRKLPYFMRTAFI